MNVVQDQNANSFVDGLSGYGSLAFGSSYQLAFDPRYLLANPSLQSNTQEFAYDECRSVCDIACGSGRQILLSALVNPAIRFHGVDGDSGHIREAQRCANLLGLDNVSFECANLSSWKSGANKYDVITCSGTFSWVPEPIQQAIMRVISGALSPKGVAVLHVLTKPASLGMELAQDMLLRRVSDLDSMPDRLVAARAFAKTFQSSDALTVDAGETEVANWLLGQIASRSDDGVSHEYLGAQIHSFYFREIESVVNSAGLNIVGDAEYSRICPTRLPRNSAVSTLYDDAPTWSEQQELIDMFGQMPGARCLLLRSQPRSQPVSTASFSGLHVALHPAAVDWSIDGYPILSSRLSNDLSAYAMRIASMLADAYPFTAEVKTASELSVECHDGALAELLEHGLITLSVVASHSASWADDTPCTHRFAQLENTINAGVFTSRTGQRAPSHPFASFLLRQADGSRTIEQLAQLAYSFFADKSMPETAVEAWRGWWPSDTAVPVIGSEKSRLRLTAAQFLQRAHYLGYFE